MPRIQAATVAEHVAHQRAAVIDAALRLFVERGYHAVTLGDIAAEVGLARNSLYRYVPDKAHLLVDWFRIELPAEAVRSAQVLAEPGTTTERVSRWALAQLDYARRPEHRLIAALGDAAVELDDATRAELAASHDALAAPLRDVLAADGLAPGTVDATVALLGGLVLAAARHEAAGGDRAATDQRLLAAVSGLVGS